MITGDGGGDGARQQLAPEEQQVQGDADAPGEHPAPAAHLRALGVIAPQAKTQKKVHE